VDGVTEAERVIRALWYHIDRREFGQAGALLAPQIRIVWPASCEILDRDQWVRANAEYGGDWAASVEHVVASGREAVCAARVWARDDPSRRFHAVSFATVEGGRITALVEYWSDVDPDAGPALARIGAGLSTRA